MGSDKQITAYPNPAIEKTTVSGITAGNIIRLLDITGRIISTQTATGNSLDIRLSGLSSETYTIQVLDNNTLSATIKLIKQ